MLLKSYAGIWYASLNKTDFLFEKDLYLKEIFWNSPKDFAALQKRKGSLNDLYVNMSVTICIYVFIVSLRGRLTDLQICLGLDYCTYTL